MVMLLGICDVALVFTIQPGGIHKDLPAAAFKAACRAADESGAPQRELGNT
jgi:hypothetical protein